MKKDKVYPKYMVFLPLILFVIFFVIPSTLGYFYAFTDWSATRSKFSDISFTGLTNLADMITNRKVPIALVNTFIYAIIKTVVVTVIGLALAYILNRKIKSRNALRTLYFLPAVLSPLVVGLIFCAVFQNRGGTANAILAMFGMKSVQWFGARWTGIFAISFAEVWRNVGYAMVISLAGMQSVSSDYIEAAHIDGANEWQTYINVTLPLIMPTVNVNILFSLIYGLKMFDLIYVMTGGGPGSSTESFGTLMLNEMGAGRYATSVAVNLIFTVILIVVAVLYKRFSERWEQAV